MDGISRSRRWDKEIPQGVLPMEQLVLSDKWARIMCLAQGHNTVTPVRLVPAAPLSRVKHSTTEPLGSLYIVLS